MKTAYTIGPKGALQIGLLRAALGELGPRKVYRQLALETEQQKLLRFLTEASPKASRASLSDTKRWLMRRGMYQPTFFGKSWRVEQEGRGQTGVALLVQNLLESGSRQQRRKFKAIEFGSRTSYWEAREEKWWKNRGRWLVQEEELLYRHAGTPPAKVLPKAEQYVREKLVANVRAKLTRHVTTLLERI